MRLRRDVREGEEMRESERERERERERVSNHTESQTERRITHFSSDLVSCAASLLVAVYAIGICIPFVAPIRFLFLSLKS